MEYKDYYKILDVDRKASADDIQKAYKKLARKYHPDLNPGDASAEEKFKDISKWVRIAVNAAEQIYNESGMGEVKKEYVLEFLKKRGITMDIDSVDALIESEVYKLNSSK